jgi:hypothetical protein
MDGLDPHVMLPIPEFERTLEGRLVSYTVEETDPVKVYRVTLDDHSRDMLWSTGVSDSMAQRMRPYRDKWIALAKERGRSSFA